MNPADQLARAIRAAADRARESAALAAKLADELDALAVDAGGLATAYAVLRFSAARTPGEPLTDADVPPLGGSGRDRR